MTAPTTGQASDRPRIARLGATFPGHLSGLFAPAPPGRPMRAREWSLAALAALVLTALSLGRTPGFGPFNTVWLEDGTIFLQDAVTKPSLTAIITPYAGYYHLGNRLLAEIASLFPAGAAAAVMSIEAALAFALLAVVVFFASAGQLRSVWARLLVAAPVVLFTAGYTEVPNALNELRWPQMYATFWLLLWRPQSRGGQVLQIVLMGVLAFSDNVIAIFIPLALLRLWLVRDRFAKVATALLVIGFALNATTNLTGLSEHYDIESRWNPAWALAAYVIRPVPQALVGEDWVTLGAAKTLTGMLPVAAGWLVLAALAFAAWRGWSRPNWPLAIVALCYSCALYVSIVMIAGFTAPRYSSAAAMLAVTAAVALARPSTERQVSLQRHAVPIAALTVLMAIVAAANYRGDSLRGGGPSWSDELAKARATCATGASTARLQVAPETIGWYATLPCDYLRS